MDFDDYSSIIKRFSSRNDGGVLFDMPVSIKSGRLGVDISSGRTYFDGNFAVQLAKFKETDDGVYGGELLEYYDGSEICRVKMVSAFIKCLFEQKFIKPAESYYVENFSDLVNSVKKDIDTNQYLIFINNLFRINNYFNKFIYILIFIIVTSSTH